MRIFISLVIFLFSFNANASSISHLVGKVTNNLGIRDDILRYIETAIPNLTESSKYAVMKIAANQQALYYKVKSYAEASSLIVSSSVALKCLGLERSDDYEIFKTIEHMMMDTSERKEYIMNTCSSLFGHDGLPHKHVPKNELADRCRAKDY